MSRICWSCAQETKSPWFCDHCHKIQGVAPLHAFERMEQPISFDIDVSALEQKYFQLQRQMHPDRFVQGARQEKIFAAQQSAALNDAFAILKKSATRAQEMLKIVGHVPDNIEQQSLEDPELLMMVIDLREALLEVKTASQKQIFQENIFQKIQQTEQDLSRSFADNDYTLAASRLNRLRYFNKIHFESQQREVA